MIHYRYSDGIFKKEWQWFVKPCDITGVAMATFFSYDNVDVPGFKKKKTLTSRIDLSPTADYLWNSMRKKMICKQIMRGGRNGIRVVQDTNYKEFRNVYTLFRKHKSIGTDRYDVLQKNGLLFSAYYHDTLIAGGVFIADGRMMRAWVLASKRITADNHMREIIGQANRIILWESIKYAKAQGYAYFDLGGIRPDSENPYDRSLAEFKESFGGVRTPCYYYSKVYSPTLKTLLRLRRALHL